MLAASGRTFDSSERPMENLKDDSGASSKMVIQQRRDTRMSVKELGVGRKVGN